MRRFMTAQAEQTYTVHSHIWTTAPIHDKSPTEIMQQPEVHAGIPEDRKTDRKVLLPA